MAGLIGKKVGMTRLFTEEGLAIPVTVVAAGPCPVLQVKTEETDGYAAVQLGFGSKKAKRSSKAEVGHAGKAGLEAAPSILREFTPVEGEDYEPGQELNVHTGRQIQLGQGVDGLGATVQDVDEPLVRPQLELLPAPWAPERTPPE
jgi:large subunit ribosomal protein L3